MGLREGIAWAAERALGAARARGRNHVDGADDAEQGEPAKDAAREVVLPAMIWIEYETDAGAISQRTLTLREVWRRGPRLYLQAWCHMRREVRSFQADRIRELLCLATGEAADDPVRWLERHALFAGEASDDTPEALKSVRDELALLAYLGRADGVLDPDEVEVAVDHVARASGGRIDRALCAAYIERLAPDPEDLPAVLQRVAADGDRWARFRRSARRMMEADGEVSVGERAAWNELKDAAPPADPAARVAEFMGMIGGTPLGGAIVMDFGGMIIAAEPRRTPDA
jgi:hypothetical protein